MICRAGAEGPTQPVILSPRGFALRARVVRVLARGRKGDPFGAMPLSWHVGLASRAVWCRQARGWPVLFLFAGTLGGRERKETEGKEGPEQTHTSIKRRRREPGHVH